MNDTYLYLSLVPPITTIAVAMWSKRILPSLLLGLLVSSYLLNPSVIGGFETAIDHVVKTLSDEDNLQVLLFLYLFSGLIALVRKAGGVEAFSNLAATHIKSETGFFGALWALIPVTFIDCAFRIVGAGSMMRALAEKHHISKERFAFALNNTASPVIELVPIATTFVGFNVAIIGQSLKAAGVLEEQSAYSVLVHAIPFEFFSIMVLLVTFVSIFHQWRKAPDQTSPHRPSKKAPGSMDMEDGTPEIAPRVVNLVVPTMTVIVLSFFYFWYFGRGRGGSSETILSVIAATDPNKAMLVALFVSLLVTGIVYACQKYPVTKMTKDMIAGGNDLMPIIAILVVAWSLAAVSQELGLSSLIQQQLGTALPGWSVPVSLFAVACAVTYFIGEGWAAASLIMPFGVSLALSTGAGIPICVAAVVTGGTFGDTSSPIAGMTNMASEVTRADHMKYMKYALPYNVTAMGLAATLFLIFGVIG